MTQSTDTVVLVTGASTGFGKAIAGLLAREGYKVVGTSRKEATVHSDSGFEMAKLDVRSEDSVHGCVEQVVKRHGRIDTLVNNAGFLLAGAIEETALDEAKGQFETNFFGVVRMTRAVLPIMRRQGSGRIINIGSMAGLVTIPFGAYYASSKFALEGYTEALRQEVRPFGVSVSLVQPGFFRTEITDSTQVCSNRLSVYNENRKKVIDSLARAQRKGADPARVARCVLGILRDPRPRLRYKVGKDAHALGLFKRIFPDSVFEWGSRMNFKLDSTTTQK